MTTKAFGHADNVYMLCYAHVCQSAKAHLQLLPACHVMLRPKTRLLAVGPPLAPAWKNTNSNEVSQRALLLSLIVYALDPSHVGHT